MWRGRQVRRRRCPSGDSSRQSDLAPCRPPARLLRAQLHVIARERSVPTRLCLVLIPPLPLHAHQSCPTRRRSARKHRHQRHSIPPGVGHTALAHSRMTPHTSGRKCKHRRAQMLTGLPYATIRMSIVSICIAHITTTERRDIYDTGCHWLARVRKDSFHSSCLEVLPCIRTRASICHCEG